MADTRSETDARAPGARAPDADTLRADDAAPTPSSRLLEYPPPQPPPEAASRLAPDSAPAPPGPPALSGLHAARLGDVVGPRVVVTLRGHAAPITADLAEDVSVELLRAAAEQGQRVLVEFSPGEPPQVVGVLQTQPARHTVLDAEVIELRAAQALTLRSGRAGIRLTSDGRIELLGTHISAASRGLLRLVGRALRLN